MAKSTKTPTVNADAKKSAVTKPVSSKPKVPANKEVKNNVDKGKEKTAMPVKNSTAATKKATSANSGKNTSTNKKDATPIVPYEGNSKLKTSRSRLTGEGKRPV